MESRTSISRRSACSLLATGVASALAPRLSANETAIGLPKEVVEAWKAAGATYGRFSPLQTGNRTANFEKTLPKAEDIPAFYPGGMTSVKELPAPDRPFGIYAPERGDCYAGDYVRFTPLVALDFLCGSLTTLGVRKLAPLKELQVLNLHFCPVDTHIVKELAAFPKLKCLALQNTNIGDLTIKELAQRVPKLEWLTLDGTRTGYWTAVYLKGLSKLRSLTISSTQITNQGVQELAHLTSLEQLDVGDNDADDQGIRSLAALPRLKSLSVYQTQLSSAGLEPFQGHASLNGLSIALCQKIDDQAMKFAAGIPALRQLYVSETSVGDAGLKHIVELPDLEVLHLSTTKVTDAGLVELAALKKLTSVDISTTAATDACLKTFAGLERLESFYAGRTRITDRGLKDLATSRSIRTLFLRAMPLTYDGLKELAAMPQLETLVIDATLVNQDYVDKLKQAMPTCAIYWTNG